MTKKKKKRMDNLMNNHKLHAPAIGALSYLVMKDKTANAMVYSLGITAVSYWYMSKFAHRLASLEELERAVGMK